MGDSKFFLIIVSFLAAIILSFQGCSGAIQTNGNGDPYEGLDTGDTLTIVDGPIDTPTSGNSSGGSGSSNPPSNQNGNTQAPDFSGYNIIYQCQSGLHIDFIAFAENASGEKKILLRARNGDLKSYPWNPSQSTTNIFQALSNDILAQEATLNSNKSKVKVYYFMNGESSERLLESTCTTL